MPPVDDLLKDLAANLSSYRLYQDYYQGRHRLRFATEKFRGAFGNLFREFADNLVAPVVNAVANHLEIEEFSLEEESEALSTEDRARPPLDTSHQALITSSERDVWRLWERNRMDLRAGMIHKEALISGVAYAIVWPDPQGRATIYPQRSSSVAVQYSEETLDTLDLAIKVWRSGKRYRLNVYYPDRIERFITRSDRPEMPTETRAFAPLDPAAGMGEAVVANEYGVVPVFAFATDPDMTYRGRPEIHDAVPLQDALNKSVLDMLVAMEFAALPQRWATGIEIPIDPATGQAVEVFKPGVDRVWAVQAPDARFGEFGPADLRQFLAVSDSFRMEIARITSTPLHYFFMQQGTPPSGEALKTAVEPFTRKLLDRQTAFGNVHEDMMAFAYRIEYGREIQLDAKWKDPAPRSGKELSETLVNLKTVGASAQKLLSDWGYTDLEIEEMEQDKAEAAASIGGSLLRQFDQGQPGATGFGARPVPGNGTGAGE